jgi:cyanoexosortase B-associated protein
MLKMLATLFVLAIAAFTILPNYVTGNWSWTHQPEVPNLNQVRELRETGLEVTGWQTLEQQEIRMGGHDWSVQAITPENEPEDDISLSAPVILFMRPQTYDLDMPQVDWMDINGVQKWTVDNRRRIQFSAPSTETATDTPIDVTARFFRGWTQQGTYAVMQWYAWPTGGHPAPGHWFWADQFAQLRDRQKLPWIAVSVMIPMKPLGDIETVRELAASLGSMIQSDLNQNVF